MNLEKLKACLDEITPEQRDQAQKIAAEEEKEWKEASERSIESENIEDSIIKAKQDLIDRMNRLKELPPPSLEEVWAQWAASEKWDREYGFGCVEKIKNSNYIR